MQGDTLLGTLTVTDLDQPWFLCLFAPEAAFEAVRPLFDAELAVGEAEDHARSIGVNIGIDAWESAYQNIEALGLRLVPDVGETIDHFLLHINGAEAWFRY